MWEGLLAGQALSIRAPVPLCGGYNYDSTSIWRALDCLSKVSKVTVM